MARVTMARRPRQPHTQRTLSDPERRLWNRVARTVAPKDPKRPTRTLPTPTRDEFALMMRRPPASKPVPARSGPLEPTAAKAVRRGRVEIGAKVDLHDLTLADAYPALARALIRAYNANKGCVLVITGKGPRLEGKIRGALPGWLAGDELRPIVATYAQAHLRHGGAGAWYVFLKKVK